MILCLVSGFICRSTVNETRQTDERKENTRTREVRFLRAMKDWRLLDRITNESIRHNLQIYSTLERIKEYKSNRVMAGTFSSKFNAPLAFENRPVNYRGTGCEKRSWFPGQAALPNNWSEVAGDDDDDTVESAALREANMDIEHTTFEKLRRATDK